MKSLTGISVALALLATFLPTKTMAQEDYRFDIGAGLGMTGYLGDANTANLWSEPGWDFEALFRYIANPRWAFKTNFYAGNLRGDSSKMTNVFPGGETFSSPLLSTSWEKWWNLTFSITAWARPTAN